MTGGQAARPLTGAEIADARKVITDHFNAKVSAAEQLLASAEAAARDAHGERALWQVDESSLTPEQRTELSNAVMGAYDTAASGYATNGTPGIETVQKLGSDLGLVRAYLRQTYGHDMSGGAKSE